MQLAVPAAGVTVQFEAAVGKGLKRSVLESGAALAKLDQLIAFCRA